MNFFIYFIGRIRRSRTRITNREDTMDTTHFPNRRPPTTGLRIEVDGDRTALSGPRALMARILSLPLLNYWTMDGQTHTEIFDPIPHNGAMKANGAMREARE
jgi:hypothetical protein